MSNKEQLTQPDRSGFFRGHKAVVIALTLFALLLCISVYFVFTFFRSDNPSSHDALSSDHMQSDSSGTQSFDFIEPEENLNEEQIVVLHESSSEDFPDSISDDIFADKSNDSSDGLNSSSIIGPDDDTADGEPDDFALGQQDLNEFEIPVTETTGVAYLTFDDGPSQAITSGILDLLAEEGIKATFFVISRADVEDIYKRIIDEGHEIGNHSYSHNFRRLYRSGIDAFRDDLLRMHDFLFDNFGYTATSYRFPGGSMSWSRDVIKSRIEVLEDHGYKYFDWHVDSRDGTSRQADNSAQAITNIILGTTDGREHVIILMHDFKWRDTTLEALPAIINGLREQGYAFDTISNYPG